MALKDIFTMVKANKYTQDGRDELNKAREAETEDARRTYQIGEISEATGLQKTANGWRPPKETKFGKVKQNKEGQWGVQQKLGKGSEFIQHKNENEAKRALSHYTAGYNTTERSKQDPHSDEARQQKQWNKETDKMRKASNAERRAEHASHFQESIGRDEKENKVRQVLNTALTPNGDKVQMTKSKVTGDFHVLLNGKSTGGGFRDPQKAKEEFNAWIAGKKAPSESAKERINKRFDESEARSQKAMESKSAGSDREHRVEEFFKSIRKDKLSPVSRVAAELDRGTFDDDVRNTMGDGQSMEDLARSLISPAFEDDGYIPQDKLDTARKFILKRYKALESDATDSAPRTLTGDTRLRLSQVIDKVYQIGEISQKTGLQKTANGWVKPKTGKAPGAKTGPGTTGQNVHGAEVDKIYERQLKRIKELKRKGYTDEQIDNDKIIKQTKEDMRNVGKKPESKPAGTSTPIKKYKDLPGAQKKDALFASTFEGISIGQTQNQMERQGWDLIEADDKVNVYGKPDGSKVTMKHDGKNITETSYEAPGATSDIPDFKGMSSGDFDKKLQAEGWTTGGWEGNGTHSSAIFKKGNRTIRVNEGQPGKITSIQEISRDAAPRQLTGDTKIRVRKA